MVYDASRLPYRIPLGVQDVKQFARCTNCRQWYVRHTITTVEIFLGNGLRRTTLWCLGCISSAEYRSQLPEMPEAGALSSPPRRLETAASSASGVLRDETFQHLIQEHLDLMERALHEDDAILIPLIDDFMQRCRTYNGQQPAPDQAQRLTGHLQYWDAFLQALNRSRS